MQFNPTFDGTRYGRRQHFPRAHQLGNSVTTLNMNQCIVQHVLIKVVHFYQPIRMDNSLPSSNFPHPSPFSALRSPHSSLLRHHKSCFCHPRGPSTRPCSIPLAHVDKPMVDFDVSIAPLWIRRHLLEHSVKMPFLTTSTAVQI